MEQVRNKHGTLGYFTVINFDADEENPENLLFKNGIGLTELITLELNEDGEYEVTDCIPAEDGEAYTDSVEEMCELIGIDPDVFYEKLAFCDLAFASDLHNFLEENPEYDYVDYMGELVSHEDLDNIVDELFYDYLALYGLAELVAEEAEPTKTFQLGTSSYTIEIPESFEEGEKSEEDVKDGLVVYMKSPEFKTDFDVYQYSKEGCPEDLAEHVQNEATKYNTTDIKTDVDVNGVTVARCEAIEPFEGKDYDTITYYLDDDDTYVEIVFWLWDEASEEQAESIFSTLSSTKN